jgi:flagellar biosynthesis/type III secretory pathway M-ring protein FliF/YscJ
MDFLKNQFQRIQQQLSGLTATQKMLTGALVAIMVMTLLYWGRYAGTADMEPLFEQALSPQAQGPVQDRLQARGIRIVTGSGGQLLVPAERRAEILADLAYAKALPRSTETGFEQVVVKLSPWASATERDAYYNRAKEISCGSLINLFPDVSFAQVMIDNMTKRQIGAVGGGIEPSATINITMRDGGKPREIAEGAAAIVQGAQSNLRPDRIKVVINGRPQRLSGSGVAEAGAETAGMDADELFDRKAGMEQRTEERITELFEITGLRVKVSAKINASFVTSQEETIDPKAVISKPVEEETRETTTGGGASGEPGAVPNVGQADAAAVANGNLEVGVSGGGGGGGSTDKTDKTRSVVIAPKKTTSTRTAPGEPTVVSASIRVPHSWFVNALKLKKNLPDDRRPDDQALQAYIEEESENFRKQLRGVAGMPADAAVYISDYPDILPPPSSIAAVPQTATMSIPVTIGKYGKEIALSGLALVSLFMISMMVKKSAPPPIPVAPPTVMTPQPLMAGEALAGEAAEGGSMLDGMELDEDAVKTEQMLDQVSTLVKENPDGAAALVKRWLNRD